MVSILIYKNQGGLWAAYLFPGNQLGGEPEVVYRTCGDFLEFEEMQKLVAGVCRRAGYKQVVNLYHD